VASTPVGGGDQNAAHFSACAENRRLQPAQQSRHSLSGDELALLYPSGLGMRLEDFLALPLERRQTFRLIVGHFFFGLHYALPSMARYIVFLRAPLARVRSHIRQHLRFDSRFFHEGREVDLTTVVNEGLSLV
jgi:hypothetical protein